MSYAYTGAKIDLSGRGFLGFNSIAMTTPASSTDSIKTKITYSQVWPYTGMPSQILKTKQDGTTVLNQVDNTFNCVDPQVINTSTCPSPTIGTACAIAVGNRYLPYVSQSKEYSYDWNGSALPAVTTANIFDSYGNALKIDVSTTNGSTPDGYSKSTCNTYTNDTTYWYLGRLTRSTVTSTTP